MKVKTAAGIDVQLFNQADKAFWEIMGPWFASAKLKRDLGIAMSSDDSYLWFIAFSDRRLVGFCAVVPRKKSAELKHLYVLSEAQSMGVETQLLGMAIASTASALKATVRKDELPHYEKQGFKVTSNRGSYFQVAR